MFLKLINKCVAVERGCATPALQTIKYSRRSATPQLTAEPLFILGKPSKWNWLPGRNLKTFQTSSYFLSFNLVLLEVERKCWQFWFSVWRAGWSGQVRAGHRCLLSAGWRRKIIQHGFWQARQLRYQEALAGCYRENTYWRTGTKETRNSDHHSKQN